MAISSIDRLATKYVVTVPHTASKKFVRADIQALRALAVTLVIANHFWPRQLSGGYIGVDIFFVISGFLITSHLYREVASNGRIDLPAFWARRARRLIPAATVVLVVSAVIVNWMPITSRQSALEQIGGAAGYFLNWLLAATSMDYFASTTSESPVTHYWSLSVEEQFYIVWPLLLVLATFISRRQSSRVRRATIGIILTFVFVASLAYGVHSSASDSAAAYFETTGRAWEFSAGGLLVFAPHLPRRCAVWSLPVVWIAWMGIALAALRLNGGSGFPGVAALIPVALTAFLIWVGDVDHRWAPTGATSLGPVQFLGEISYSLYLWHWPLIVVAPFLLHREITARDKLVILGITVTVAYLTKRYVEDTVRQSRLTAKWRPRLVLVGTGALLAAMLVFTSSASHALAQRAEAAAQALINRSETSAPCFAAQAALSGLRCDASHVLEEVDTLLVDAENQGTWMLNGTSCQQNRESTEVLTCEFGAADEVQNTHVALVGDSHAGMWAATLSSIAERRGLNVRTYLKSACPVTADPNVVYMRDGLHNEQCRIWREAVIAEVAADPEIDVVVTSSIDRSYLGAPDAHGIRAVDSGKGYAAAWRTWLEAGKQVVVLNEIPERDESIPGCIARNPTQTDPCTMPSSALNSPGPLESAAAMITNEAFTFVDFQDAFCDELACHSVIGGIPAYIDASHLSAAFARSFASEFLQIGALG